MQNSEKILKEFSLNGYYVAKNILKKKNLDNVLDNFCRIYFKTNPKSKFLKYKRSWENNNFNKEISRFCVKKNKEFSEIYDSCQSSIVASQITSNEKIFKTVSTLLRCKFVDLSYYLNMVRMDIPFDKRNNAAWHQEVQFFYNPGLTVWVPLTKISDNMGFLNILEKSHSRGEIVFRIKKPNNYSTSRVSRCEISRKILSEYQKKYKHKKVKVSRGDVIFFNNNLLHKSGNNTSNRVRFTFQTRFFNTASSEFAAFKAKLLLNPFSAKKLKRKFL